MSANATITATKFLGFFLFRELHNIGIIGRGYPETSYLAEAFQSLLE